MSDKKKQKVKDSGLDDLDDYARQIWLAGLGAYARLGKEGSKLFDALIRDGEETEKAATKGSLDGSRNKVEKARKKLTNKLKGWEELLDKRLHGAAERMGLASQAEVQALTERVDQLTRALAELRAEPTATPKPVRKAPASKPAVARAAAGTAPAKAKSNAAKPKSATPAAAAEPAKSKPAAKSATRPAVAAVKTTPRRRSTTPKAATRGKTGPAPATDAAPGIPPEL
ncbi:MAG: phasin family protein [Pseudomonas sp.]